VAGSFDPFTIEIVKDKLHAAADEMGVVLARTSMSPIVYEVLDFACGITDADAQVVAQTNGLTLFTGTFGPQIQSILRKHGLEGMREGDVFATNIPYEGGTHTCDVCLVKPILIGPLGVRPRQAGSDPAWRGQTPGGRRVIGFAVSVTHWIEIGGAVPGSISPEATEIYQEGLQLPGVRVVEQGVPNQTLIDMIEANIRLPRTGIGDLNAGLAATAIGEARVREACERYGVELVLASFARVLDHGEQIARAELRMIPNGVYTASGGIDGDGVTDAEIPIAVAVTVGDDFLHADFTGCAPQTRGPVNCSTGALLSACKTVVRAITAPSARSNDGFFRPFSLTVPPGTVFSAEPPAPTGWYYEGAAFANDLIWKALAPVVPDRLGAGSYTSLCCSYVVGTDEAGELFVLAEPNVGGWGGSALGDGASALIATTDGDTYNFPVEVVESRYPVLVERYALNVEAGGGAGRHRGGFGVVRTYRVHGASEASGYGSIGGFGRVPWALGGGSPGTENFLDYTTPHLHLRRGRVPRVGLTDGAVVSSVTGTGGGFGDPFEREPERVREDVLDGYVTVEQARTVYGVALDPESLEPDAAETARLRAR
jgi:N-methylhydantoinase B